MKKWIFLGMSLGLAALYVQSHFFAISTIRGPLFSDQASTLSSEAEQALSQPYRFLSQGKQTYVFVSADHKWVIKFFNQKYHRIPLWTFWFPKQRMKRQMRKKFYLESYQLAWSSFKEESAIIYLHVAPGSSSLPRLDLTDKMGCNHSLDLNDVPFVLQRKAVPLYAAMECMSEELFDHTLRQFLGLIAKRIDEKICDGDHEVEKNYGILDGRVVQFDPGRLYKKECLWESECLRYEWWSATHRFRKWLQKHRPEKLILFDNELETNLQQVLQRSQVCPALQTDELRQAQSPGLLDNAILSINF